MFGKTDPYGNVEKPVYRTLPCIATKSDEHLVWLKDGKEFLSDALNTWVGVRSLTEEDRKAHSGEVAPVFNFQLYMKAISEHAGIYSCGKFHYSVQYTDDDQKLLVLPLTGTVAEYLIEAQRTLQSHTAVNITGQLEAGMNDIVANILRNIRQTPSKLLAKFNSISYENKFIFCFTILFTYLIYYFVTLMARDLRKSAQTYSRMAYLLMEDSEGHFRELKDDLKRFTKVKTMTRPEYEINMKEALKKYTRIKQKVTPRRVPKVVPRVEMGKKTTLERSRISKIII